jgi:hypothetical protein
MLIDPWNLTSNLKKNKTMKIEKRERNISQYKIIL